MPAAAASSRTTSAATHRRADLRRAGPQRRRLADFTPYRDEYDHWLWKKVGRRRRDNGGHGGIDYILQWRIVQQMRAGLVPDIDVYDSATWCSPVPLSVASLERGGRPVDVPDFTRGRLGAELRAGLDSRQTEMPPVP